MSVRRKPRGWVEHRAVGQRIEWTRTVGYYRIDYYPVSGAGLVTPLNRASLRGFTFSCTPAGALRYTGAPTATEAVMRVLDLLEDAVYRPAA